MHLYAALDDRVLAVRDGGDGDNGSSLDVHEHRSDAALQCLAASPAQSRRLFVGTADGRLERSTDAGRTWETVLAAGDRVTSVTVSPHDADELWAGTEPSAVYRSADAGETWTQRGGLTDLPSADRWSFPPRPSTHHVRWIELDPTAPDRAYLGIEAGAFVRTTDGGETWDDHPSGARRDNHTLATHPDDPGRVYAAAGDGYAESHDAGRTWTTPDDGPDHRYVWGLAVDPGNPERVVVSAARGARRAHYPSAARTHLYRRTDDGWERGPDGFPDPEGTVRAVLDAGPATGRFVALTNRGLYTSDDAGESWSLLPVEWSDEAVLGRGLSVVG